MDRIIRKELLSILLAIVSITIPLYTSTILRITNTSYNFILWGIIPHLGIAISGAIGGHAGVLLIHESKDESLRKLAGIMFSIATLLLIGGLYIGEYQNIPYVYMYSLVCPPFIGFGVAKFAERIPYIKKRNIAFILIIVLLLPSIALLLIGINLDYWVNAVDFGTGLRVLFGAMIGAIATTMDEYRS